MSTKALLDHFSALDDPRQSGKVIYPLAEIMLVVLCATLAAAEDFVEVRRWGEEKLDFLRTMLPFAHGIPSHDTLNDTLTAIAQTILDKGADYLLALKDNWPVLAEDVRLFFADPGNARLDTCQTTDLGHPQRPRQGQPQNPSKSRSLEPRIPPRHHLANRRIILQAIALHALGHRVSHARTGRAAHDRLTQRVRRTGG